MYKYDIEVENMRTISILGSTGSIGTQTLEVVEVLGYSGRCHQRQSQY